MSLRVGFDLTAVAGVDESLRDAHRNHYLERIYTACEVDDCRGPSGRVEPARRPVRRQEATIKVLPGAGEEVRLTQIELVQVIR